MVDYHVQFARSARKELEGLDPVLFQRVLACIESLSTDPRPSGCKRLKGQSDLWRVRVGDYRIVYSISDKEHTVDIWLIRHRRHVYGNL